MGEKLVLVFDVGTQSTRGLLIDQSGGIVGSARAVYDSPYYSLRPNWAEQRPDYYFEQICAVSRQLRDAGPEDFCRIELLCIGIQSLDRCILDDADALHLFFEILIIQL